MKNRIIIINSSLRCGGTEKVITELANYWSQNNLEVSIFLSEQGTQPFFQLDKDINVIEFTKGLSRRRLLLPLRKIFALWRLRKGVFNISADKVFIFQEKNNIYAMVALMGSKVPKILAVRNHPGYKKLSFIYSFLRGYFYPKATRVVVQTEDIKQWLIEFGLNEKKLEVIPNPVQLYTLPPLESLSTKTIMACGRLEPQKGFKSLIAMFKVLAEELPDWKLQIIGDGSEKSLLQKSIIDNQLEKKVELCGFKEIPQSYYKEGQIFAFTSVYEGFPNSLCEAMASGMAVVSYDCPSGPADIIEDGVNGYLVKLGDREAFTNRLGQLMGDEGLRMKMGSKAKKIKESFTIENIAQQWLSIKDEE